jgi:hypoxanthine phosphoribosyltransferase
MEAVKGRLRNLRILIVDDDKDTREMLRFVLHLPMDSRPYELGKNSAA